MKKYSNSKTYLFNKNCPYALECYEKKVEIDRGVFHGGIASHAILQAIGEANIPYTDFDSMKAIADKTVEILITEGRTFQKNHEPPLPPDDAFAGRDIVLRFLKYVDSIPPNADFELGLGMTATGEPSGFFDEQTRWRAILDVQYPTIVEDETYQAQSVVVRDYKTSWQTSKDELDTIQMRGCAVLSWLHCDKEKTQAIVQEVINLRTWQNYRNVIILNDEGIAQLKQWRDDLLLTCTAMDKTRQPRPGAGCIDCNYNLSCEHCLTYYKKDEINQAVLYATLEAMKKATMKIMKKRVEEEPIEVPGGIIEFRQVKKNGLSEEAVQKIVEHWYMADAEEHSSERALLRGMEMTATNVTKLIEAMYPEKDDIARAELFEQCFAPYYESRFGVYKK